MLVEELMSSNYELLPASMSPAAAALQLGPGGYGVVVGEDGAPVSLVTPEDVDRAGLFGGETLGAPEVALPPTVVVGRGADVSSLRKPLVARFFGLGSRGVVVLGASDEVVGVLGFGALYARLLEEEEVDVAAVCGALAGETLCFQFTPAYLASWQLVGALESGAVAVVLGGSHTTPYGKVKCRACGYENTVQFLDNAHLPPCKNPAAPAHPLGV